MTRTLSEKIWDAHLVRHEDGKPDLLYIDLHLVHEVTSAQAFEGLRLAGRTVRRPDLTLATVDHNVPTRDRDKPWADPLSTQQVATIQHNAEEFGVPYFGVNDRRQGIVHIIGPEQGLTQPGMTIVCGDSHTSTHGGMGALAYGIGASELVHVIATQTMVQRKPKRFRASFEGKLQPGVTSKDMILHLIGDVGTAAGTGFCVEYAGSAIRALPLEARLTLCNLTIEMGARTGMVAPDDTTYEYLYGRDYAPKDAMWDRAVAYWRTLPSDPDAEFDREHTIDMANVAPQITWGTSPEHVIAVDRAIPDPRTGPEDKRAAWEAALQYQGLEPGKPIEGTPVDWVFIGSCTNSRITDLRAAAEIAKGRHKADHVTAWVVPGSERIKKQAESEGLDRVFLDAGFEWREPGCSMCLASNGERVPPGKRSVSTSNRNFVGRQGPGARTHLASPAMAAAAAIKGAIADVRKF